MTWLTSLSPAVLVLGWLAFSLAVAALSRLTVRAIVPAQEADHARAIAGPLMPALGATFAILTALTLAGEAGYLRAAQDIVSTEAAAASRLAWAATSPGVATEPIHAALLDYLDQTRRAEWNAPPEGGEATVAASIAALESVVRADASREELGTPVRSELLAALDDVTTGRRERLAAAARQMPTLYAVTVVLSGLALIANAGALTLQSGARTFTLVAGLAVVVGLSFALLFAIAEPWRGGLIASGEAIDAVLRDLRSGYFRG